MLRIVGSPTFQVKASTFGQSADNEKYFFHTLLSYIYIGNVKCNVARNITGIIALYLHTLANRNYPICVALPKVAKASTVADCRVSLSPTVLLTNVANVNDPLLKSL